MALLSLGSVMTISIRMPIIVDILVFVSMISFMLGQVEHETHIFFASYAGYYAPFCGNLCLVLCFWFKP